MKKNRNRYYGIAWNFEKDSYRGIGLLENITKYEEAEDIMFIHNSVEKFSNGDYRIPTFYYRRRNTETEHILEISDLPSSNLESCSLNLDMKSIAKILFDIEYGIWKIFDI